MTTDPTQNELLSLVADVREQLRYFHELGIENLEPPDLTPSSNAIFDAENRLKPAHDSADQFLRSTGTRVSAAAFQQSVVKERNLQPDSLFGDLGPTLEKSAETFDQIRADVGNCTRCPLYQGRTNIVHTEGNPNARLVFIGEAPGADEDAQARPFVGRAGQLLTKIIESIGFKREDVLIGNVNRCRPPGNRPPTEEEASMCKPFLLREIAAVQPEVIVVLGNTAMKHLLNTKQGITKLRGQFQDYQGIKVMPTFHPAYLLRDPSKKQETWHDLKKVRDYLESTAKR